MSPALYNKKWVLEYPGELTGVIILLRESLTTWLHPKPLTTLAFPPHASMKFEFSNIIASGDLEEDNVIQRDKKKSLFPEIVT